MLTKIRLSVVLKNVFASKPHWKMQKQWFYMLLTKNDQKNQENRPNLFIFRWQSGYVMWIPWMLTKTRLFVVLKNVFVCKTHWKMQNQWFYWIFTKKRPEKLGKSDYLWSFKMAPWQGGIGAFAARAGPWYYTGMAEPEPWQSYLRRYKTIGCETNL